MYQTVSPYTLNPRKGALILLLRILNIEHFKFFAFKPSIHRGAVILLLRSLMERIYQVLCPRALYPTQGALILLLRLPRRIISNSLPLNPKPYKGGTNLSSQVLP
jgi:hypothetical protein